MKINYNTFWDEQISSHSFHPSVRLRNKFILSNLKKIWFDSIIDVWCWDWELLNRIKMHFSNKRYFWTDISDKVIERDKNNIENIEFFVSDIWDNKFNVNQGFDIVIASEVIEHIGNWQMVIKNLSKIINKNWYCILTTQSWKRYKSDINIWHLKHFQLNELENEFKKYWVIVVKSYKKWWPFYNMQKWLYEKIESRAKNIQKGKLTFFSKIIFVITYYLFLFSLKSKKIWPQIFMVLKKV